RKTLGMMGRPADGRIAGDTARDVCQRTGGTAVVEGSIASLGTQYVIGLRARYCATGDVLDDRQAQAARKEDVLTVLSQLASQCRGRAGEWRPNVEQHSTPLDEATTSSLDELKAFTAGTRAAFSNEFPAALPLFKRAVAIDPNFATAYVRLADTYGNLGESV